MLSFNVNVSVPLFKPISSCVTTVLKKVFLFNLFFIYLSVVITVKINKVCIARVVYCILMACVDSGDACQDSSGFQEVSRRKTVKDKARPADEATSKMSLTGHNEDGAPNSAGGAAAANKHCNIASGNGSIVSNSGNANNSNNNKDKKPISKHPPMRQNKLPPRFAKHRDNNGRNNDNDGSNCSTSPTEPSSKSMYMGSNAPPAAAPPPTKNAWEKPLASLRSNSPSQASSGAPPGLLETPSSAPLLSGSHKGGESGHELPCTGGSSLEEPGLHASSNRASPHTPLVITKDDTNSLDGSSVPCKTIIFENTNFKASSAGFASSSNTGINDYLSNKYVSNDDGNSSIYDAGKPQRQQRDPRDRRQHQQLQQQQEQLQQQHSMQHQQLPHNSSSQQQQNHHHQLQQQAPQNQSHIQQSLQQQCHQSQSQQFHQDHNSHHQQQHHHQQQLHHSNQQPSVSASHHLNAVSNVQHQQQNADSDVRMDKTPLIELPITFPKGEENVGDMKLDFTFHSELNELSADKVCSSKSLNLVRSLAMTTSIHTPNSPSTEDLNMKIASVKKVWDVLPVVSEHVAEESQNQGNNFSTANFSNVSSTHDKVLNNLDQHGGNAVSSGAMEGFSVKVSTSGNLQGVVDESQNLYNNNLQHSQGGVGGVNNNALVYTSAAAAAAAAASFAKAEVSRSGNVCKVSTHCTCRFFFASSVFPHAILSILNYLVVYKYCYMLMIIILLIRTC